MEKFYNITEFAELINKSVKTLQRWDRDGVLKSYRSPTNRRYYTQQQYLEYIGNAITEGRQNVIYARVSTRNQKDDLKNQISFIQEYCKSNYISVDDVYVDFGSGLNYNRKQWNKMIDQAMDGKIKTIYIAYKDRFTRFGFDWIQSLLKRYASCEIVVINDTILTPEEEVVEDLISIIHEFSCRCYGLREYESKFKKVVKSFEKGD